MVPKLPEPITARSEYFARVDLPLPLEEEEGTLLRSEEGAEMAVEGCNKNE